jgi:hypothetical protein
VDKEQINSLLRLYFTNQATHQQREALFDELQRNNDDSEWEEMLLSILQETPTDENYNPAYWQGRIKQITKPQGKVIPIRYRAKWIRIAAAAVIILAIGITAILILSKNKEEKPLAKTPVPVQKDVLPGGAKAVLTLGDGRTVILDSAKNGALAVQGNIQVVKSNGTLAYNEQQQVGVAQNPVYNTVSTPKGGQYQLTLADGSKVWLNAASSIRFPTAFTGRDRVVEITGEAYFEVKHDAAKPFIVSVNDMQVEVLGTHFNINSYSDEAAMKTTLLEGKVRVSRNGNIAILNPGEQAISSANSPLTIDHSPDLDEVMAWKNGLFHFNNASLQEVIRQIVRWYDVDVVYQGTIPERKFGGEISRNSNLSQVLKILEESKVHFTIENKKLIVKP